MAGSPYICNNRASLYCRFLILININTFLKTLRLQVILWDLNRTFPGNDFFKEGNDGQRRLYHVCKSYAGQDPEVGLP